MQTAAQSAAIPMREIFNTSSDNSKGSKYNEFTHEPQECPKRKLDDFKEDVPKEHNIDISSKALLDHAELSKNSPPSS